VRHPGLGGIHVAQPVIGDHLARGVQDQPAERIALVGIGVDPPIGTVEVLVDRAGHIYQGALVGAQTFVAVAVTDVGTRGTQVIGRDQGLLDDVLDTLDIPNTVAKVAVTQYLDDLRGEQTGLIGSKFTSGLAGTLDGGQNSIAIEWGLGPVPPAYTRRQAGHLGGRNRHGTSSLLYCRRHNIL